MWKERSGLLYETDEVVANRRTASLGGVAITLLLLVLSLSVVRGLQAPDTIGDRLNPGQVNCDLELHDACPHSAMPDWIRAAIRSLRQFNS